MNNEKIEGGWIFPNGNIYYTDNIDSHIKVICEELNLKESLLNYSKTINWTNDQKERYLDIDVVYLAMKQGYIRVTSFIDQFAIQYVDFPFERNQINAIFNLHQHLIEKKTIKSFSTYLLESYETNNFIVEDNIFSILEYCG